MADENAHATQKELNSIVRKALSNTNSKDEAVSKMGALREQLIKNHKVFTEEHPYNERHPNKDLTSVVRLDLVRRINKKLGTNLDV
ncbi:MAG: hypothetical protein AAGA53_15025, partial [Pseudomonadota bacterium]